MTEMGERSVGRISTRPARELTVMLTAMPTAISSVERLQAFEKWLKLVLRKN
jgi:hypothetical protein